MSSDYLKYWRVVRYFIKSKYGLTTAELETLLFLKSETYFDKKKFKEFNELCSWDRNRFDRLLRDGWIDVFRKREGSNKTIYKLSFKSKKVINSVYDKLNGNEIPSTDNNNPMFFKKVKYTDKGYKNMIKEMNRQIRAKKYDSEL